MLESKYILIKYIPPTIAPFNSPFLWIFEFDIVLPINMLIAVITIIVGVIKFSLMFVYVKITENINKNIIVVINDIIIPFIIFEIDVVI